ncbi:sugar nucleotide-binding protein [Candidatus Woesebacteria bacterium]|nr:sugar nucleotide-binding protein [Candidatus Woesebacteria bacterium]
MAKKNEPYTETDPTNPVDWYSETKLKAEEVVTELTSEATILRINFPYRQDEFPKADIWHKMANALREGKTGPFFDDHFFTLTPIEWFADIVDWAITAKPAGIFHATTDTVYTDLSLATEIRDSLGLTQELTGSSVHTYNQTAERPYAPSLILSNEKLKAALKTS